MESVKASKVKRRRRGKKRPAAATATAAASAVAASSAAAAFASLPSKSGDDSSELDTEDIFFPCKQSSVSSPSQGQSLASLRPVIVPRAPENSTQFLIDDHENSSLFLNFENSYKSPSWCLLPEPAHVDVDVRDPSDDEEHYYMRDFESEYQNAKEEALLDWSRETLSSEILRLEERANALEQMLILQDPDNYLNKLQERLVQLQDENERLRANLQASTTGSGSGSGSSSCSGSLRDANSSISASSDEDGAHDRGLRHRARSRTDTASDLVMVVAPLSLRDADSAASPTSAGPRLLHMEIA